MNKSTLNSIVLNGSGVPVEYGFTVAAPVTIRIMGMSPSRRWSVSVVRVVRTIYICTLDDIRLPMSSFQARLRDGEPTYFGPAVTYDADLLEQIQARAGGTLTLWMGVLTVEGNEILEKIAETTLHSVRYDKGGRSGSITLVGYKTDTTEVSKVVAMTGISSESLQANGKRMIRCEPSYFLRPGDVARWGDQQMVVGMIALTVHSRSALMNLTER